METKSIPAILMLLAGAVACVLGFVYHYETTSFFIMILIVLLVFYVLGCMVKIVVDINFKAKPDQETAYAGETDETDEMKENVDSEKEENEEE